MDVFNPIHATLLMIGAAALSVGVLMMIAPLRYPRAYKVLVSARVFKETPIKKDLMHKIRVQGLMAIAAGVLFFLFLCSRGYT